MIKFKDVSFSYAKGFGLSDITLKIEDGEFLFLIGPTGSGKSTLFRLIHLELMPENGEVIVGEYSSSKVKKRHLPKFRRSIGFIAQDYQLLVDRNLFENVALPLHVIGYGRHDISDLVIEMLDDVGLKGLENHHPYELSGGEQQRACLARALIKEPDLILADEPTGNLDPVMAFDLIKLLEEVNSEGTTVFIASHNYSLTKSRKHRILEIRDGKLRK